MMLFIPPKSKEEEFKEAVRREQRLKKRSLHEKPSLNKVMRNQLSTTQGMSTLKLVLIYSVLGMVLNWTLPLILRFITPEMLIYDAKYFGTVGAICITGFFLLISLTKGFIQRNRASKPEQPPNAKQSDTENSRNRGLLDGK